MNTGEVGVGCSSGREFPGSTPPNQEAACPLGRLEFVTQSSQRAAAGSTRLPGLEQTAVGNRPQSVASGPGFISFTQQS